MTTIERESIRSIFEEVVKKSPLLSKNTPLGIMEINGEFSHYMDPDTDTMWIGFAMGMRAAEKYKLHTL